MTRNVARPVLSQRINRLLRFLPGAALCVPAAVHDARVATRRLREALPVVARGRKGKALFSAIGGPAISQSCSIVLGRS